MEQKKLKHSKYKNTGILFELLVQQVTSDILKEKTESAAKNILQKYFHENTNIGKELKLYQFILNEKIKTQEYATRLIETVLDTRKKISANNLNKEKFNLVKDIKEAYNLEEFFKGNVSDYKVLASIYKLFENAVSTEIFFESKEIFQAKNCLVEHVLSKHSLPVPALDVSDKLFETYKKQSYDEKILTYKVLVDSFNKKYKNLSEEQKSLLREYVNGSDTTALKEYIEVQIPQIVSTLKSFDSKINNAVIKIKLNEVVSQLNNLKIGLSVKDNQLTTLLMSYELIKELSDTCK